MPWLGLKKIMIWFKRITVHLLHNLRCLCFYGYRNTTTSSVYFLCTTLLHFHLCFPRHGQKVWIEREPLVPAQMFWVYLFSLEVITNRKEKNLIRCAVLSCAFSSLSFYLQLKRADFWRWYQPSERVT